MASLRVTYASGKERRPSCNISMARKIIFLIFLPFILATEKTVYIKPKKTFATLYSTGVDAYNDQTWFLCASSLEDAIKDYTFYKDTVIDCRIQCKKSTTIREVTPEMVEFSVFERIIENSDCIRRCKRHKFGDRIYPDPRDRIFSTFQKRKPYEYLQFCWFQVIIHFYISLDISPFLVTRDVYHVYNAARARKSQVCNIVTKFG